jgi:hypothetical protein
VRTSPCASVALPGGRRRLVAHGRSG